MKKRYLTESDFKCGFEEDLNSLLIKMVLISISIITAISIPTIAWFLPEWSSLSEDHATWFQRSGSLVVLCAATAEFLLLKMESYVGRADGLFGKFKIPPWYRIWYKIITVLSHLTLVVGTIIWGYGDILYCSIKLGCE